MTPPPSIAGLIAELRAKPIVDPVAKCRIAAGELEKLLTADETRVRDISRLTIERDTARDDLAAAKGALRNHVINHWYNAAGGGSAPYKCTCDECNGEWLPNEPEKHVGDCAAAFQPKVETMIARFDEKVKTWTPQQALDYLVELGTHDADGNLTPEYGGPSPQGDESALREEVAKQLFAISAAEADINVMSWDQQDERDKNIWRKMADVINQRVSRIAERAGRGIDGFHRLGSARNQVWLCNYDRADRHHRLFAREIIHDH